MSKLVDTSSDADMDEERRKSETDLAASQGIPAIKSAVSTNDMRNIEKEVCSFGLDVHACAQVVALIKTDEAFLHCYSVMPAHLWH